MSQSHQHVQAAANSAQAQLTILNNPSSSPHSIAAANAALTQLKDSLDVDAALHLAAHLLSPVLEPSAGHALTLPTAHFAFLVIDSQLLSAPRPFSEFPIPTRTSLRALATTLLSNLTPNHPALLVQKTVVLLSALAVREWPQRWASFLDDLLSPKAPPALACRVLNELSDDVYHFSDHIDQTRRAELRHALALAIPKILPFVTSAAQVAHTSANHPTLSAALNCLRSLVAWADLRLVLAANVSTACVALLPDPHARDAALKVLDALISRTLAPTRPTASGPPLTDPAVAQPDHSFRQLLFGALLRFISENPPILQLFVPHAVIRPAGALPALVTMFDSPTVSTADAPPTIHPEAYAFLLALFALLADLGSRHFSACFLFVKRDERVKLHDADKQVAFAFVDLFAVALSAPSSALRHLALPFFTSTLSALSRSAAAVASTKESLTDDLSRFILSAALRAGSAALIRLPGDSVAAMFAELDDEDDELGLQIHAMPSRMAAMLTVASRLAGGDAVALAFGALSQVLRAKPALLPETPPTAPSAAGARAAGVVVVGAEPYVWTFGSFAPHTAKAWLACVEAATMFADSASTALTLSDRGSSRTQPPPVLADALHAVLALSESSVRPTRANALRVFIPLYIVNEQALESCVSSLIDMASTSTRGSGVRSRSLSSLSSVFRRLNTASVTSISRFSGPLCDYAMRALVTPEFRNAERVHLLEATLASVLTLPTLDERVATIERVLEPLLSFLTRSQITSVSRDPLTLFTFLDGRASADTEQFIVMFGLLEAAVHQVVRPLAKKQSPLPIPGVLSRAVAPKSADLGCAFISVLHGLYNDEKFKLPSRDDLVNVLHPTCRELLDPLNLENPDHMVRTSSSEGANDEQQPGLDIEQRSEELIRASGLTPPDPKRRVIRQQLREMRRSAYEVVRATIFSGVTKSPQHVNNLLTAVCTDCTNMEPVHLLLLMSRVLMPLFSFTVCSTDASFLEMVASSDMPALIRHIRELILASQKNMAIFSATQLLDVSRENGRTMIARSAADIIFAMYPKIDALGKDAKARFAGFMAPPVQAGKLGEEWMALWETICNPGRHLLDKGAARVGFQAISVAAELAPENQFGFFNGLLVAALRTTVLNSGASEEDSPFDMALGAMLSVMRRWPDESKQLLCSSVGTSETMMHTWISECISAISTPESSAIAKSKKLRGHVRTMIEKIAQKQGMFAQTTSTVRALPEKLKTVNLERKLKRAKQEQDDVILAEHALDSLFGEGDPL